MRAIIADIHHTADRAFIAVIEDWESTIGASGQGADRKGLSESISTGNESLLGLPQWHGISAGVERLSGLLTQLSTFIAAPTASTTSLPLGSLIDLITRIFSIVVPSKQSITDSYGGVRLNPEVGRHDREALWAGMPRIHVAALGVMSAIAIRLGTCFLPLAQGTLDQVSWVFTGECFNCDVRAATYVLVAELLKLIGPSLTRSSVLSLVAIIEHCCKELLPNSSATVGSLVGGIARKGNGDAKGASSANADAFLKPTSSTTPQSSPPPGSPYAAASALLPLLLAQLPQQHLSYPLRAQIDRTAVLTQHRQAMVASVLNPTLERKGSRGTRSIMPLLARSFGDTLEVEGLLRPRMPVLQVGKETGEELDEAEDSGQEDSGQEDGVDVAYPQSDQDQGIGTGSTSGRKRSKSPAVEGDASIRPIPEKLHTESATLGSHSLSIKRDREIAEVDDPAAVSERPNSSDLRNNDAPAVKRVRVEPRSIHIPDDQVHGPTEHTTQMEASSGEAEVVPGTTNRSPSIPAPVVSLGIPRGLNEDSDDDFEIPPLVLDSDTDEEDDDIDEDGGVEHVI